MLISAGEMCRCGTLTNGIPLSDYDVRTSARPWATRIHHLSDVVYSKMLSNIVKIAEMVHDAPYLRRTPISAFHFRL
jgi:hypothetical protein